MSSEMKFCEKYVTFDRKGDGEFACWIWDAPYKGDRCFRILIPVPRALWEADGDVTAIIEDEVDSDGKVL